MIERKFNMTQEENIFLAKRNIVDSIWKEANLEGIAITFPQTQEIFEGRTVSGLTIEQTLIINNLKRSWEFVLDNIEAEIDLRFVREVNSIVGADNTILNAGTLREYGVQIGGTNWVPEIPTVASVTATLDTIKNNDNPTERGLLYFGEICRGQWFSDGNKRTAQLVANAALIKEGCGVLAIPTQDLLEVRTLLIEYYETNDFTKLSKILYERALEGINNMHTRIEASADDAERYNAAVPAAEGNKSPAQEIM